MSTPILPLPSAAAPAAPAASRRSAPRTFARRRLLLGISGVGTSVVLSVVWLLLLLLQVVPLPAAWNPGEDPVRGATTAAALVLGVFVVHAIALAVLEYLGGAVAVREPIGAARWLSGWVRGIAVQGLVLAALSLGTAVAGVRFGRLGVLVGVAVGSTLLLAAQGILAPLVARIRVRRLSALAADTSVEDTVVDRTTHENASRDDAAHETTAHDESRFLSAAELSELSLANGIHPDVLRVVDAPDEAFVGGWVGIGRAELWIPRRWTRVAHRELLTVQLARRYAQRLSGARRRGLLRAALWPVLGLTLVVPLLPWTVADAAFWLALPAVSTLWTFVAVLLLPAFSRPVVYSADAAAAKRLGTETVQRAIRQLDAWQDDEAERSPGVEFIFHPVPSRGNRERALGRQRHAALGGAHQQTRLTLYASLAAFGLLGRAVHCNIGRPSLWVLYPGD